MNEPGTITPELWFEHLGREYLDSFICQGGSAVKFAVPHNFVKQEVLDKVVPLARERGYLYIPVDSAVTQLHMVHQVFFAAASRVPWREIVRGVLGQLAHKAHLVVPEDDLGEPYAELLAQANQMDASFVRTRLSSSIENDVFKNHGLLRDFRVAMTHLCLAELNGGSDGDATRQALVGWLSGTNTGMVALRRAYSVVTRINRSNARSFLEPLMRWVKLSGRPGTVLVLDITRTGIARNPNDGKRFYAKASLMDLYEVLRQFIDATDRLKGCLAVVVCPLEFLDVTVKSRGLGGYPALRYRVYDEIRDNKLVNPMGALVRLADTTPGDPS